MINLTDEELQMLKSTTCEQEWNAACDAIKRVRGGGYPDDWWAKVMKSGLAASIVTSWNRETYFPV